MKGILSGRKWYVIPDFRGTVGEVSLSKAAVAAWHIQILVN